MCASRNLTRKFVDLRNAAKANKSLKVHQNLRDTSDDSNSLLHVSINNLYILLLYTYIINQLFSYLLDNRIIFFNIMERKKCFTSSMG
jgi:hypothetical protein